MPLTHDIGVRIPYPLQKRSKEMSKKFDIFCFCWRWRKFTCRHLPIKTKSIDLSTSCGVLFRPRGERRGSPTSKASAVIPASGQKCRYAKGADNQRLYYFVAIFTAKFYSLHRLAPLSQPIFCQVRNEQEHPQQRYTHQSQYLIMTKKTMRYLKFISHRLKVSQQNINNLNG